MHILAKCCIVDLKSFIERELTPICEADPNVLSEYIIALLRHELPSIELQKYCSEQLVDFLRDYTEPFVRSLFSALESNEFSSQKSSPSNVSLSLSQSVSKSNAALESDFRITNKEGSNPDEFFFSNSNTIKIDFSKDNSSALFINNNKLSSSTDVGQRSNSSNSSNSFKTAANQPFDGNTLDAPAGNAENSIFLDQSLTNKNSSSGAVSSHNTAINSFFSPLNDKSQSQNSAATFKKNQNSPQSNVKTSFLGASSSKSGFQLTRIAYTSGNSSIRPRVQPRNQTGTSSLITPPQPTEELRQQLQQQQQQRQQQQPKQQGQEPSYPFSPDNQINFNRTNSSNPTGNGSGMVFENESSKIGRAGGSFKKKNIADVHGAPGNFNVAAHGAQPRTRPNKPCFDFAEKGKCDRKHCPFEHYTQMSGRLSNDAREIDQHLRPRPHGYFGMHVQNVTATSSAIGRSLKTRLTGHYGRRVLPHTSIVVDNIPQANRNTESVLEYFSRFGKVEDLSFFDSDKRVLVQYSTLAEAATAHDCPEPIFGNRFVKVYYYNPITNTNTNPNLSSNFEIEQDQPKTNNAFSSADPRSIDSRLGYVQNLDALHTGQAPHRAHNTFNKNYKPSRQFQNAPFLPLISANNGISTINNVMPINVDSYVPYPHQPQEFIDPNLNFGHAALSLYNFPPYGAPPSYMDDFGPLPPTHYAPYPQDQFIGENAQNSINPDKVAEISKRKSDLLISLRKMVTELQKRLETEELQEEAQEQIRATIQRLNKQILTLLAEVRVSTQFDPMEKMKLAEERKREILDRELELIHKQINFAAGVVLPGNLQDAEEEEIEVDVEVGEKAASENVENNFHNTTKKTTRITTSTDSSSISYSNSKSIFNSNSNLNSNYSGVMMQNNGNVNNNETGNGGIIVSTKRLESHNSKTGSISGPEVVGKNNFYTSSYPKPAFAAPVAQVRDPAWNSAQWAKFTIDLRPSTVVVSGFDPTKLSDVELAFRSFGDFDSFVVNNKPADTPMTDTDAHGIVKETPKENCTIEIRYQSRGLAEKAVALAPRQRPTLGDGLTVSWKN